MDGLEFIKEIWFQAERQPLYHKRVGRRIQDGRVVTKENSNEIRNLKTFVFLEKNH